MSPPRSSRRSRATRWPRPAAARRPSRPPRSARSSPAPSRRCSSPSSRRPSRSSRCSSDPPTTSRSSWSRSSRSARCWARACRAGMTSLGLGLLLGLVGTEVLSGQQRYTFGVPALADGIDVVLIAVGLFAIGESLYVASRMRHGPVQVIPVTGGWRTLALRQGLPALVEAVAARHRDRVPDRHDPGGRCGRRDVPLVCDRATARQGNTPRPSSAAVRSRAWPARSRRTTRRPPACSCRCSRSDCRPRRRRRSSSRRSSHTASVRDPCCSRPSPAWSGRSSRASTSAT